MAFIKASAEEKMVEARSRNPIVFDRLMSAASTGHHGNCWPVTKNFQNGYGVMRVNGKKVGMHRLMFELYFPLVEAPVVRHKCNNPSCINPAHLREGTKADNNADRMLSLRGGDLRGQCNGRSKLTDEQVIEIRNSDMTGAELGRKFNVSKVMACKIRRGDAWKHI